ncbi:MAG TPA: CHRD domain-containing protein [Nitrospirota bacterium]|nr:CHRD domain-containing protein [Nitrospirota bacterium]
MRHSLHFVVWCIFIFTAAALAACGGKSSSAPETAPVAKVTRDAFLTGSQVISIPPVSSRATGTFSLKLDSVTGQLSGSLKLSQMAHKVTAVGIREGAIGANGDLIVSLVETPAGSGVWTLPADATALTTTQTDLFRNAGLYADVRTDVFPNGEIRGQFMSFAANIQPIFDAQCVSCHDPGKQAQFTYLFLAAPYSFYSLVNQPATQSSGIRVIPYDAAGSFLLSKTTGNGLPAGVSRMPPGGPFLSDTEENLIRTWIIMGALND